MALRALYYGKNQSERKRGEAKAIAALPHTLVRTV
jgi:hypothetical protein